MCSTERVLLNLFLEYLCRHFLKKKEREGTEKREEREREEREGEKKEREKKEGGIYIYMISTLFKK